MSLPDIVIVDRKIITVLQPHEAYAVTATKSRKGAGKRQANRVNPKASKPSKSEMYLRSVRMHETGNLGRQHMTAMAFTTKNDRLFIKLHAAEVIKATKAAAVKAARKAAKAEKKAIALLKAQKSA